MVQKHGHGLDRIEHSLIHIDIDYVGPAFHLFPGDSHCFLVITLADQPSKLTRASYVGALAHHDEVGIRSDLQPFQSAQGSEAIRLGGGPRAKPPELSREGLDMFRRGAATATDHIQPALLAPLLHRFREFIRPHVVAAEFVRQAGVRVGKNGEPRQARQFLHKRRHLMRAKSTVDAYARQVNVTDGGQECLQGLTRKRATTPIRYSD